MFVRLACPAFIPAFNAFASIYASAGRVDNAYNCRTRSTVYRPFVLQGATCMSAPDRKVAVARLVKNMLPIAKHQATAG
jgi:hypothetical protein